MSLARGIAPECGSAVSFRYPRGALRRGEGEFVVAHDLREREAGPARISHQVSWRSGGGGCSRFLVRNAG
jgi:hypothetical protein